MDISSAHGLNLDDNHIYQGLNIQITGIPPGGAADTGEGRNQNCKVGKAGPKGDIGEKGVKGEPAASCECLNQQNLLDKIDHLEQLLLRVATRTVKDCDEVNAYFPFSSSGVHTIYPASKQAEVYCDIEEGDHDGVWTVIQRRFDGSEDFYRDRSDYIRGFGNANSEYWIGLDNMHSLTRDGDYELKVNVENWEGEKRYAVYSTFVVGNRDSDYILTARGYSGTAGDSLTYHSGMRFSTKDHDVDPHASHCSQNYMGGWWYNGCYYANPNGLYLHGDEGTAGKGMEWWHWYRRHNYSMKKIEFKIRKKV